MGNEMGKHVENSQKTGILQLRDFKLSSVSSNSLLVIMNKASRWLFFASFSFLDPTRNSTSCQISKKSGPEQQQDQRDTNGSIRKAANSKNPQFVQQSTGIVAE